MGNGPHYWRLQERAAYGQLANKLRNMVKMLKMKSHGRQRSHDRIQMQNASAQREEAVAAGKIGHTIRAITGQVQQSYDLHPLTLPTGDQLMDPIQIHDVHVQDWKEWLGGTQGDTFFDHYTIDWTRPQKSWIQFRDFPPHAAIPEPLLQQI